MPFTVEIDWIGRTFVWEDVDGPEIVEKIELFGDRIPEPRSFPIELVFSDISLAEQLSRGHSLMSAVGRVKIDGTTIIHGRLRSPQWGRDEEPVRASIEESPYASVQWPNAMPEHPSPTEPRPPAWFQTWLTTKYPGATINGTSTPIGDRDIGGAYPVVFGAPGASGVAGESGEAGSPTIRIQDGGATHFVIAAHPVQQVEVAVLSDQFSMTPADISVSTITDSNGDVLSTVTETDIGGGYTSSDGDQVWVAWSASGGGLSPLLGDVVEYLLRRSPLRVDLDTLRAYAPALNRFRVDTYVAEPVDILDLLDEILEPFPAALVQGRGGAYVWIWVPDAPIVADLVVTSLTEVTGVFEDATLRHADTPGLLRYQLRYRRLESSGDYASITTARGAYHRAAAGVLGGEVVIDEAPHIASAATAQRCADLRVRALGRPPLVAALRVTRHRWGHLRAGDAVQLTDEARGIKARRGVVTRIADAGEAVLAIEVTMPIDPLLRGEAVVVAVESLDPTLPLGAYFVIDPHQSPGTYSSGTYTSSLPDQSGNGRDFNRFGTVVATTTGYAVRGGTVELPVPDSSNTMFHTSGLDTTVFTWLTWGHHDQPLVNLGSLGAWFQNTSAGKSFGPRWDTGDGGRITLSQAGTGTEIADAPFVPFPQRGGAGASGSDRAWYVSIARRSVSGSTSTWRWAVVADLDDGTGVRLLTDTTWSETTTMGLTGPGEFQDDMENNVNTWTLQQGGASGKEAGGCALWASAMSDASFKQAATWAAHRFSEAAASFTQGAL